MSAKIINFPIKRQPNAKPIFEKSSAVKPEAREELSTGNIKKLTNEQLNKEMFPPDYFMLVE